MVSIEKDRLIIEIQHDDPEQLLHDYRKALTLTTRTILANKDNFLCEESCEYFPFLLGLLNEMEFDELQLRKIRKLLISYSIEG
jgi:hypothetical protein